MATRHLPLILKLYESGIVEWWVDASFSVHEDMRSRTDMHLRLGVSSIYGASLKQKINTISSTETELGGIVDAINKILWCKYFMEAQEYLVETYMFIKTMKAQFTGDKRNEIRW